MRVKIKTSDKERKELLEAAMVIAVIQPLTVLPQILHIFNERSAQDVSLLTWALLLVFNSLNLIYATIYRVKPMIINNVVWVIIDAAVVIGVTLYG